MHRSHDFGDDIYTLTCAPKPKTAPGNAVLRLLGIVIIICLAVHPLLSFGQVTTSKTTFSLGETISATFTNSDNARDWVGLYEQGTLQASCQPSTAYRAWSFAVLQSGTVRLPTAGLNTSGNYQLQMFRANTYCHIGNPVDVVIQDNGSAVSQALSMQTTQLNTTDTIAIRYLTGTGQSKDWIGIFPAGKLNQSCESTRDFAAWHYTNGSAGTVDFEPLPAGTYVAQLFSSNSYCHIGERITFRVITPNNDNDNNGNTGNTAGGPPRLSEIFSPRTEHFAAERGTVRVQKLGAATRICVAANGVQPSWNRGRCAGDGVQRIDNPPDDFTLTLQCNGETGAQVARPLKLVFNWPDGKVYLAQADYQLTCTASQGTNDEDDDANNAAEGTLSPSRSSYTAGDTVVINYQGGSGSSRDWIGIFKTGQLNNSCEETEDYVTWVYTNGTGGRASFDDLDAGVYQAQLFENDGYCHLGNPVTFSITPGNNTGNGDDDNGNNNTGNNNNGNGNTQSTTRVTINPYETVNWGSWNQYKANFHTHTTQSDGDDSPAEVIDNYFAANYKILAITDHDTVTWPWTRFNRDPDRLSMLAVRGDEFSRSHHVNGFFDFSISRANHAAGIENVQDQGGLCHFNHPLRYNSAKDWDWYVPWYEQYPACVGIEAINRRTQAHALWDNINENLLARRNKLVWGYANDDMHDRSELFRSFQFMLMPNLSENALRNSKRSGAFYFCHEPGGSGEARVPRIARIEVDNQAQTITVTPQSQNLRAIRWVGPGTETVGSGGTFNFSNYPSGSFVRAELEGNAGSCYTQPFGIGE